MPGSSRLCSLEKGNTKSLWVCLVFFGSISASDPQNAFAPGIKCNGTANDRICPPPDYFHLIRLILDDYPIMSETNKRNDGSGIPVLFEELINMSRTASNIKTNTNHSWQCLVFMIRKSYCVVREAVQVPAHRKLVTLWRVPSLLKLKNNHLEQVFHNVRPYRSYRATHLLVPGRKTNKQNQSLHWVTDSISFNTQWSQIGLTGPALSSFVYEPDYRFTRIQAVLLVLRDRSRLNISKQTKILLKPRCSCHLDKCISGSWKLLGIVLLFLVLF